MANKPVDPEKAKSIITDWRIGKFKTLTEIALFHRVSVGLVHKLCKGVEQDGISIVKKGIAYKQELAAHDEKFIHDVEELVHDKIQALIIIQNASMKVTQKAIEKVSNAECTMLDLKLAQEIIGKGKDNIFGKQPNTAIQINNTGGKICKAEDLTDDELAQIIDG
jgi:hypothetical protein